MESVTINFWSKEITRVDEGGYITKVVNASTQELNEAALETHGPKWQRRTMLWGYIAMKGERYVRTGGPLDGKTFD